MLLCKAKSKRTGERCGANAVTGMEVCRHHGGKSLRGFAVPHFKTGAQSKYHYLPERLSEKVGEFLSDPELVELRENIAVYDSRLTELYSQLGESEPAAVWNELASLYGRWQSSESAEKGDEARRAFETLLNEGASEQSKSARVWDKIIELTEQRRKLVESESKRLKDQQQIITGEQFLTFIQFVLSVIKENVTDRQQLNRISDKLITAGANAPR